MPEQRDALNFLNQLQKYERFLSNWYREHCLQALHGWLLLSLGLGRYALVPIWFIRCIRWLLEFDCL